MTLESWKTVQDEELANWLRTEGKDERELIVQANVPSRVVSLRRRLTGRLHNICLNDGGAKSRNEIIMELGKELENFVDTPPVLLKSSGVVVIKAKSFQVKKFTEHPLVKAIYPNTHLGKR